MSNLSHGGELREGRSWGTFFLGFLMVTVSVVVSFVPGMDRGGPRQGPTRRLGAKTGESARKTDTDDVQVS